MGSLNKEIRIEKPARPCPSCSFSIPGTSIPIGWGPNSEFDCPSCTTKLRARFSFWHALMAIVLCSVMVVGMGWLLFSLGDLDSGRTIGGGERRAFVNIARGLILVVAIAVVAAIGWVGNLLPHRVIAAESPESQGRAVNTIIVLTVVLASLMGMVACIGAIVSSD